MLDQMTNQTYPPHLRGPTPEIGEEILKAARKLEKGS